MTALGSIKNKSGDDINKYKDYGEIITHTKKYGDVKCIVRKKDLKELKNNNYKFGYTFRNKKHKFYVKMLDKNTSTDFSLASIIFKQEGLNTPMFPTCENPLTFDVRNICDMIEQNRSGIK